MREFWIQVEHGMLGAGAALGAYLLLLALGRILKNRLRVPLGVSFQVFALLSALLAGWFTHRFHSGIHHAAPAWTTPLVNGVVAAWVVFVALQLDKFLARFLWQTLGGTGGLAKVPKLLRDLAKVFLLIVAGLCIMKFIYGRELGGLLTASGIVAVVLGFALQNLLGDVIAGIALNLEKPYDIGDWIEVDGIDGEVVEINWRATRIRTRADNHRIIPNGAITKQIVVNFHYPTPPTALLCHVGVEYGAPPNEVRDVLRHAVMRTPGVSSVKPPLIRLRTFGDFSITYEVKFWIDNRAEAEDMLSDVMVNIWYALRRACMHIPFPIRDVHLHQVPAVDPVEEGRRADALRVLRGTELFKSLDDRHIEVLAAGGRVLRFGHGETIIRKEDPGDSLFVIVRGQVKVHLQGQVSPDSPAVSLKAGETFGEMSLLTGAPRSATVVAEGDVLLVEVVKGALAPLLHETPALAESLSRLMADRQLAREGLAKQTKLPAEAAAVRERYASSILRGISQFFRI